MKKTEFGFLAIYLEVLAFHARNDLVVFTSMMLTFACAIAFLLIGHTDEVSTSHEGKKTSQKYREQL